MDDFVRTQSQAPELDERLSYAAKIANISAINSGQMDSNPANLGTVSWTYQAMKGNVYVNSFDPGNSSLHAGWRQMSGEADLGLFGALRILSADVTVDPVFGLTGYGCDVVQANACLGVTPTDGVFKRLNLVTQKLSLALDRDRYTAATVGTNNDAIGFTLQNQRPASPHTTHVTITGMAPGTYPLSVGGMAAGTVTATAGAPLVVSLMVGAAATTAVQIGTPCTVGGGGTGAAGATGAGGTAATGGTGGGQAPARAGPRPAAARRVVAERRAQGGRRARAGLPPPVERAWRRAAVAAHATRRREPPRRRVRPAWLLP